MKKFTLFVLISAFIPVFLHAQDMGYNTFDIAAEYRWAQNSPGINLQVAANAKEHHSFIASIGFKSAYKPITGTHDNEKGRGWGGSLGYRYYFPVLPKGPFLGIRADLWSLSMYHTADNTAPSTNVVVAQPNVEAGYTILINDIFFITPFVSAGKQFTLSSEGTSYNYGQGFVPSGGISVGWRF